MNKKYLKALISTLFFSLLLSNQTVYASDTPMIKEGTLKITGFTTARDLDNITLNLIIGQTIIHNNLGMEKGEMLTFEAPFNIQTDSVTISWRVAMKTHNKDTPSTILSVEGNLNLQERTATFQSTYYNKEYLSFKADGPPAFTFQLTDIKAICTLEVTFIEKENISYDVTFSLGDKVSASRGSTNKDMLRLNSTKVTSLKSSTDFSINLTQTDKPEELVIVNGSLKFSPDGISIPTPTQKLSREVQSASYRFTQSQYGYKISLDNRELLHLNAPAKSTIGEEKTVTVSINTDEIGEKKAQHKTQHDNSTEQEGVTIGKEPWNINIPKIIRTRLDDIVTTINQNYGIAIAGGTILIVMGWMIRNKRRTDSWTNTPET